MKRHHITLGARTTADGLVTSATSMLSIDGARMALEGDEVRCNTCGGTGLIQCIGPRLPEQFNGKQVALENDLCVCQCVPHPRLLPSQTRKFQFVDAADTEWVAPANRGKGKHGAAYDQRFLLLDNMTGVPLARQPYRLKHGASVVEGVTDEDGYTSPIPTGEGSDIVE
jgi:uncharacterized Zn-binding protein involved in type VI secretion